MSKKRKGNARHGVLNPVPPIFSKTETNSATAHGYADLGPIMNTLIHDNCALSLALGYMLGHSNIPESHHPNASIIIEDGDGQ